MTKMIKIYYFIICKESKNMWLLYSIIKIWCKLRGDKENPTTPFRELIKNCPNLALKVLEDIERLYVLISSIHYSLLILSPSFHDFIEYICSYFNIGSGNNLTSNREFCQHLKKNFLCMIKKRKITRMTTSISSEALKLWMDILKKWTWLNHKKLKGVKKIIKT